jgi:hypothetical protein
VENIAAWSCQIRIVVCLTRKFGAPESSPPSFPRSYILQSALCLTGRNVNPGTVTVPLISEMNTKMHQKNKKMKLKLQVLINMFKTFHFTQSDTFGSAHHFKNMWSYHSIACACDDSIPNTSWMHHRFTYFQFHQCDLHSWNEKS